MIVACVALFVALGGVGYAAATIKSVDIKNRGIAKKDLSKKAVKALEGQKGDPGAQGQAGAPGADGSGVAYAYVNADGSVDETRSKGIADANVVPDGGIYGFRGLGFSPKNIQVTTAFDTASVTGDNGSGGQGFIGDCDFVDGVDEACVSTNNDADPGSEQVQYFVVFN